MVSYLIATAIWSSRLGRAADWTWGSVADADAPLAYELPPPLHAEVIWTSPACEMGIATVRESLTLYAWQSSPGHAGCPINVGGVGIANVQLHRFNKRPASRSRHSIGSDQENQSLLGSAITLRLLALMTRSPITDQSETKPTARQWL